jgi:PTS system mannose-specific IIC component
MELFALDVLPVGASRYPDYGPGVVGAVVLASGGPTELTLGVGTLFGLGLAVLGGLSLQLLRESNGAAIHRHAAGLAAGDAVTMALVQYRGLVSDLIRSLTLTAVAVGLATVLRPRVPEGERFALVSAVAIGCAVAAATGGAIRSAGRGARLRWLAVGAGLGLLLAVLR